MIYKTNTTQKSKDRGTRFLLDDAMKESTVKIQFRGFDFVLVHFFYVYPSVLCLCALIHNMITCEQINKFDQ